SLGSGPLGGFGRFALVFVTTCGLNGFSRAGAPFGRRGIRRFLSLLAAVCPADAECDFPLADPTRCLGGLTIPAATSGGELTAPPPASDTTIATAVKMTTRRE